MRSAWKRASLGQPQEFRAEREVILCGGAYNSPQLLMLSGVGPSEHLAMREIEVLLDQPAVGENLSDHPATQLVWATPEPESLLLALEPAALEEYEASRTGPFASNLAEAGGFARVGTNIDAPDIQFHVAPVQILDEGMTDPEAHGVWVSPCLLTEHSRGSVRLASNDPTAKPIIRNEFYSAGEDMTRMLAGLRMAQDICSTARDAPLLRGAMQHPRGRLRRGAPRPRREDHVRRLPPGGHVPDGSRRGGGGGRAASCQRLGGSTRRGCLGDAHGSAGEHQRADDRCRRARGRPDPARAGVADGSCRGDGGRRLSCAASLARPGGASDRDAHRNLAARGGLKAAEAGKRDGRDGVVLTSGLR